MMAEAETDTDDRHPETGGPMRHDVRPFTVKLAGRTYTVQLPGLYCTETGESMHGGCDYKVLEDLLDSVNAERQAAGLPSVRQLARRRAAARRRRFADRRD